MSASSYHPFARAVGLTLLVVALLVAGRISLPHFADARGTGTDDTTVTLDDAVVVTLPEIVGGPVSDSVAVITGGISVTMPARGTIPAAAPSMRPIRTPTTTARASIPILATIPATLPTVRLIRTPTPSLVGYPQTDQWWVTQSYHWSVFVGNVRSNDPDLCGAIGASTSVQTLWASDGIWIDPSGNVRVAARYPSAQSVIYQLACQRYDAASASWVTTYSGTALVDVYVMKFQTGCATPAPAQQGQC